MGKKGTLLVGWEVIRNMYIFISHNSKDKEIVEPIARRLASVYGQNNVFYDSWSIIPGDGIIEKMNDALSKCDFFFFFISQNSLNSGMVKLEWQNALIRKAKGNIRFVPVRVDNAVLPPILLETLYIDLNKVGFEVCCRQMIDTINGKSSFDYSNEYCNFKADLKKYASNDYELAISVKNYYEPIARFLIFVDEDVNSIKVKSLSDNMTETNSWNELNLSDGVHRAFFQSTERGVSLDFPFVLRITSATLPAFHIINVLYAVTPSTFKSMKIDMHNAD